MIINFNKEDKKKFLKLLEMRDINMSVADMFVEFCSYIDVVNISEMKKSSNKNNTYLDYFLDFFSVDKNEEENKSIIEKSIVKAIKQIDTSIITTNPYFKKIKFKSTKDGKYFLGLDKYYPYQAFSYNDVLVDEDDYYREISQIGYFEKEQEYIAISKNDVIWMSTTPNEIFTMAPSIERSYGHVITFGLGLGYYPFMCSLKDSVESVTIVEYDRNIINLFKKHVLPLFPNKEKIKIIQSDAFKFLKENNINELFDFAYMDIWHGPEDGLPFYIHFKKYEEHKKCKIEYWLEDSIIALARRCLLIVIEEVLNGASDKNFMIKENDIDEVINDLYFYTKDLTINSYDELHALLKKESLIDILEKIGKSKY